MTPVPVPWSLAPYLLVYGLAVAGCAVALRRAMTVDDRDTRVGLVALLVASGGWAVAEAAYLLAPVELGYALYLIGLIVGLTTIGGWLYFCSAYTGRSFHRDPTYRRAAVAAFVLVVAVKLTNPVHELYFTAEVVSSPFVHLAIDRGIAHWVVTGLSYSVVAVGFFMLFDQFLEADFDTRPLAALVGLTALPVAFDVFEIATGAAVNANLEPLGVAAFAVGTLYVFESRFLSVQLSDGVDDALIYLDEDDRVRESNDLARERFPELVGAAGEPLSSVLPDVAAEADAAAGAGDGAETDAATDTGGGPRDDGLLARERDGDTRFHLVSTTDFVLGRGRVGRLVMASDVTGAERRRRELARQNEQLESMAAAMRHELFNTLQIVSGRVTLAGEEIESGDVRSARESLRTASRTAERMERLVEDFARLARQGRTVESTRPVSLGEAARDAWRAVDTAGAALVREGDGAVEADPDRLGSLLASGFRFAVHNGASTVTLRVLDDGFSIADDGREHPGLDPATFFEYGGAVPDAEAGIALPNLRTLARVHGWTAAVDGSHEGGVRVVVGGARVEHDPSARGSRGGTTGGEATTVGGETRTAGDEATTAGGETTAVGGEAATNDD